jgi:uncharacterized RDD family membrane protein YckC
MTRRNVESAPSRHSLFSPEGVHLDLPIAGPAPRMVAYLIDFAAMIVLFILLGIVMFTLLPIGASLDRWLKAVFHQNGGAPTTAKAKQSAGVAVGLVIAIVVIVQFVIETGYFIFWEMVTNGRSPGKVLIDLRVVCRDGLPITARSSVIRNLMRVVDILPANYLVGLISILISNSGERIGDHAAGTLVVRLDRTEAAPDLGTFGELITVPFTRAQLSRIGPRELRLVRGTLRRIAQLPDTRATELLAEVAESMRIRMGLAELPTADNVAFLRSLLTASEHYSK